MSASSQYDASQITVLEGLEPVRQRPGMYIGSTDSRGLHHLITEIVDNAIDEALAGYCHNITVILQSDGRVTVHDDGRGIPVGIHPKTGRSALETVMTVLHAGGKFEKSAYKISWWLHGVGASVVNALSEQLIAQVHKDGFLYRQTYERGKPQGEIEKIWPTDLTGTTIQRLADALIFETTTYHAPTVFLKYKQSAYLTPWVTFTVIDEITQHRQRYCFQWGIKTRLENMTLEQKKLSSIFSITSQSDNLAIDIAACYTDNQNGTIMSFVNNIHTAEWGTHLLWFKDALLDVINELSKTKWLLDPKMGDFQPSDIIDGLYAIISVKVPNPEFEWQTKSKLGNSYVRKLVYSEVIHILKKYFLDHESDFIHLVEKIRLSAKARMAAKLARETVLRKTVLGAGVLPWKLSDCSSKDRSRTELFIVEGDSAWGSAKQGRNSEFQAILPLKGKVLNVEKATIQSALGHDGIKSLITAIGTGIKESFDVERRRYDKIIIMTDADVDGAHIRTLLLTFFYRYMKPLIDTGHVYIAVPPLYKISQGKKEQYIFDPNISIEEFATTHGFETGKFDIQRYKGLGEMNYDQLAETTMVPETRLIKQVNIADLEETERLFGILMGDNVEHRRHFILSNAKNVKELDL